MKIITKTNKLLYTLKKSGLGASFYNTIRKLEKKKKVKQDVNFVDTYSNFFGVSESSSSGLRFL